MIFFIRLAILSLFCLSNAAMAAEPGRNDFAYGLELAVDNNGAIYKALLPESVYRGVSRFDLADLRVFNAQGEMVPHAVRRLPVRTPSTAAASWTVPFFPLYRNDAESSEKLALQITTSSTGALVDVRRQDTAPTPEVVNAYLLDCSASSRPVARLLLAWQPAGDSFVTTVRVESSEDLNVWQPLVNKATLAELRSADHQMGQYAIELPGRKIKYLKISWPAGEKQVLLTAVKAVEVAEVQAQPRQWTEIAGSLIPEEPGIFVFDTQGCRPVDQTVLKLPEANTLIEGVLSSRSTEANAWQSRGRGVFYRMEVQEARLESEPLILPVSSDRFWRLQVLPASGNGLGVGQPRLRLGWVPHELVFLARGQGPFLLAYGSAQLPKETPASASVDLFSRLEKEGGIVGHARPAGNQFDLGGAELLTPPAPPLPWEKWLLWSVLVSGVAGVGAMAWQLFRQMNQATPGNDMRK